MWNSADDLSGLRGEKWDTDPLGSAGEERGDPFKGVSLDLKVVGLFSRM